MYILLIAMLYTNGFDNAEVGKLPEEFMLLEGGFAVQEEGGNKFLELPGAPLETFGVLFGPVETENVSASARFYGTARGRRYPTFSLGLNGGPGPKLRVSPGKKALELIRGENEVLTSVPYNWESATWTSLRLEVRKVAGGQWQIQGRAWKHGGPEPSQWLITHTDKTAPITGRAGVWGMPYAGTPIRFDDLTVSRTD